jgi:rRNA processing protein Gar1
MFKEIGEIRCNRRDFLKAAGFVIAAAVLDACVPDDSNKPVTFWTVHHIGDFEKTAQAQLTATPVEVDPTNTPVVKRNKKRVVIVNTATPNIPPDSQKIIMSGEQVGQIVNVACPVGLGALFLVCGAFLYIRSRFREEKPVAVATYSGSSGNNNSDEIYDSRDKLSGGATLQESGRGFVRESDRRWRQHVEEFHEEVDSWVANFEARGNAEDAAISDEQTAIGRHNAQVLDEAAAETGIVHHYFTPGPEASPKSKDDIYRDENGKPYIPIEPLDHRPEDGASDNKGTGVNIWSGNKTRRLPTFALEVQHSDYKLLNSGSMSSFS